jgi:hypothetical protein
MKRIVGFLSALVLVVFVLFVVRETAAVVALARDLDPRLGPLVLWMLVAIYAVCVAVPAFLFLRLPKPLVPPPSDSHPDFPSHLARLSKRLSANARLNGRGVAPERQSVMATLGVLDTIADQEIRREASLVFVSTAISQSGRLDGLFVLVVQTRLIWKIAHIYRQRASPREMLRLYGAVAATVFAAESLEDLELGEVIEPVIPPLLEAAGVGATVVLAPVATVLADALVQGTVNALLTFRIGCIAKRYSAGMPLPGPKMVRREATREAGVMLGGVVGELTKTVTKSVWDSAARIVSERGRTAAGRLRWLVSGGPAGPALYEAVKRMASRRTAPSDARPGTP